MTLKKYILILSAIFAFTFVSLAELPALLQEDDDFIFFGTGSGKMPEFPGGMDALREFINENTKYPAEAVENGERGRVVVQFTVEKTGKISNIKIIRGVSPALDEAVVRVIELMPDWIPGEERGEKVSLKFTIPINFRLPEK